MIESIKNDYRTFLDCYNNQSEDIRTNLAKIVQVLPQNRTTIGPLITMQMWHPLSRNIESAKAIGMGENILPRRFEVELAGTPKTWRAYQNKWNARIICPTLWLRTSTICMFDSLRIIK